MVYSMADPRYTYRQKDPALKARLSEIARERHGAPVGCCTVYGVHTPFGDGAVIRYFAQRVASDHGAAAAKQFVRSLRANNWSDLPGLRDQYAVKMTIRENRELIRAIRARAYNVDQNRR